MSRIFENWVGQRDGKTVLPCPTIQLYIMPGIPLHVEISREKSTESIDCFLYAAEVKK